jgi:hypothetical protein
MRAIATAATGAELAASHNVRVRKVRTAELLRSQVDHFRAAQRLRDVNPALASIHEQAFMNARECVYSALGFISDPY